MTDQNRSNTDTIGLSGGSAGTGGLSDAGVGAAGGASAVKSTPAKRGATKAGGARKIAGTASTGSRTSAAKAQVRDKAAKVREKASSKAHELASQGKDKATSKLDEVARLVNDAAEQVDEKLGPQYGGYARSAADAVAGFASTLREKDVDELVEDARNFVRKSPAVAIGAAAAIGFVLARIVKSGLEPEGPNVAGDQGPEGPRPSM